MADRKSDIRDYKASPGAGKNVKDTEMLTGMGKFSAAQKEDNTTVQYETGAAPDFGKLGDKAGSKHG